MEEYIKQVKVTIVSTVGILTGLWGWLGWLVVGWIFCMILDYITGSAAAGKAGKWSSAQARAGIWHKAGMIVVVIVAAGADLLICIILENLPLVQLPIQYSGLICPVVLVWYIITELGSMAENAVAMGAPVPVWLVKILASGRDAVDKAGEAMTGNKNESN